MTSKVMFSLALLGAFAAFGEQNHVPDVLSADIPAFLPKAAARPHVLLVNVANALPAADWALVSTYAASRIPVCIWTNALPAAPCADLMKDPSALQACVRDPKALVAVFVCDRPERKAPVVAVPGHFACINLAWLKSDKPSTSLLRDRSAKLLLKGIAAACGSGATIEPLCSLFYGSRTLAGLDKTNITISPMAYFPMVEVLRSLGGDAATAAPTVEEE